MYDDIGMKLGIPHLFISDEAIWVLKGVWLLGLTGIFLQHVSIPDCNYNMYAFYLGIYLSRYS